MIRQTRRHAAEALSDPRITPSDYTDPSAFKIGCVFLIFVAFFVAIHLFNFKKNIHLYSVMFVISLLWFFKNFRDFVVVPYNFPLQCFTIIYDLCVTKAFLRNHLILAVFSILGFQDNQWFTIMLFDIFNNSVMLQDIVKSITQPAAQVRNPRRNIFSVHYLFFWRVYCLSVPLPTARSCSIHNYYHMCCLCNFWFPKVRCPRFRRWWWSWWWRDRGWLHLQQHFHLFLVHIFCRSSSWNNKRSNDRGDCIWRRGVLESCCVRSNFLCVDGCPLIQWYYWFDGWYFWIL